MPQRGGCVDDLISGSRQEELSNLCVFEVSLLQRVFNRLDRSNPEIFDKLGGQASREGIDAGPFLGARGLVGGMR